MSEHIHTWKSYNNKGMLCCSNCNITWNEYIREGIDEEEELTLNKSKDKEVK